MKVWGKVTGVRLSEIRKRNGPFRRPFQHRGLHDQVVEELGLRIVHNEFGTKGQLPSEPVLGAELGVSRNALREAIKVLVGKGMLEVRPKTGMRIRPKSDWNLLDPSVLGWHASSKLRLHHVFDLVEFRLIVEPRASYLAAKRATKQERKAIIAACDQLEACVGHPDDIPRTDIKFHSLIHHSSHNALLDYLGRLISSLMSIQVKMTTEDIDFFKKGLPFHRKLSEAIARGDEDEAEAMSVALVQMPYDDLADRLRVRIPLRLRGASRRN
jgi:GntR family transcriptional regulator, galactonate operon transcriptional repressor